MRDRITPTLILIKKKAKCISWISKAQFREKDTDTVKWSYIYAWSPLLQTFSAH